MKLVQANCHYKALARLLGLYQREMSLRSSHIMQPWLARKRIWWVIPPSQQLLHLCRHLPLALEEGQSWLQQEDPCPFKKSQEVMYVHLQRDDQLCRVFQHPPISYLHSFHPQFTIMQYHFHDRTQTTKGIFLCVTCITEMEVQSSRHILIQYSRRWEAIVIFSHSKLFFKSPLRYIDVGDLIVFPFQISSSNWWSTSLRCHLTLLVEARSILGITTNTLRLCFVALDLSLSTGKTAGPTSFESFPLLLLA